jgi:hypothetical protein
VEGSCEHGNEPSGSIKGGKFLGQMSDCQHLNKDSAPWLFFANGQSEVNTISN